MSMSVGQTTTQRLQSTQSPAAFSGWPLSGCALASTSSISPSEPLPTTPFVFAAAPFSALFATAWPRGSPRFSS